MDVALDICAMQLSEFITIYLAAAAPFGVTYFLRHQQRQGRARATMRATVAALAWPLNVAARLLDSRARSERTPADASMQVVPSDLAVERSERALLDALRRVEEQLTETFAAAGQASQADAKVTGGEALRRVSFAARASVERYVGLASAAAAADADAPPNATETEFFRVAGREGEDLLLGARCVHRRNVARLRQHHTRARGELLHALAELREAGAHLPQASQAEAALARRISAGMLQVFGRAVELFSTLDDQQGALKAARLLDAECTRLRRLEAAAALADARRGTQEGEKPCPPIHSKSPEQLTPIKRLTRPRYFARG